MASQGVGSDSSIHSTTKNLSIYYRCFIFIFSIIYAYTLSQTPSETFHDFGNYLIYAEFSTLQLTSLLDGGVLYTLANEPVWLLANSLLAFILSPETVVRSIIFLSAFAFAYIALRVNSKNLIWIILFLLLPNVIKNYLIHIRQGAAVAVFLVGWFTPKKCLRFFLIGLSPFIHTSFFFVIFIFALTKVMSWFRLEFKLKIIIFIAGSVFIGITLQFFAMLLGARQAQEYEFSAAPVSGGGWIFWSFIAALMLSQGQKFWRDHTFETGCILFYLSTYFLIEVTGRIFESSLLLILVAGLELNGWRLTTFKCAIFSFFALSWFLRIDQPLIGFGMN